MAYATVNDLRAHLDFDDANRARDAELESLLDVVTAAVEQHCGRTFGAVSSSGARIFPGGTTRCLIDDAATVTIVQDSSDRQTWSTVATTDWWTEPANSTPYTVVEAAVPLARFVKVTGTWGHGATVPAPVKHATVMWAARLWKRRQSVSGVEGFGEFGPVRISRHDADIEGLLAGFRRADRVMGIS